MIKIFGYFSLFLFIIYTSYTESVSFQFKLVRVSMSYKNNISNIIDKDDIVGYSTDSISIIVGKYELDYLDRNTIPYRILMDDAERYYSEQIKLNSSDFTQSTENFNFGSMGYFYKLNEIYSEFEKMIGNFKEYFVSYEIIGRTYEDRDIICYTFGAPLEQNKPQILLTALHHAREPASVVAIIYFLQKLFENANRGDKNAKYLLKERTIFVIPVVNPDGYYFNEKNYPNGGGLWRKNRRKINDSTFGVDLNRNYGPYEFWNSSNGGSLSAPNSNLYRGSEPFSELETRAVRDFCNSKNIRLAFNYHTFGDVFIVPYSSLSNETRDSIFYRYLSVELTKFNKYAFGLDYKTIGYPACGTADDWMHFDTNTKNSIIALTPEVGNIIDNFWLMNYDSTRKKNRIIELAKENYYSNLMLLWSAGTNIIPFDLKFDAENMVLSLNLRNIGLEDLNSQCKVSISSNSSAVEFYNSSITIDYLKSNAQVSTEFLINPKNNLRNGTKIDFYITLQYEGFQRIDTFGIKLFKPEIITLYKSGDNLELWETEYWGTEFYAQDGIYVLSDSPGTKYRDSLQNYITLKKPISLQNINAADIEFSLKWEIDYNYDIATVEISTNNGLSWNYIETSRMKKGLNLKESMHKSDIPAFTGHFPLWIRQFASLDQFIGNDILIRFGLLSGPSIRFDGIFIEYIQLLLYPELMSVSNRKNTISNILIYPNPANIGDIIYFEVYQNKKTLTRVSIFNYLGQLVFNSDFIDGGRFFLDTQQLKAGLYLFLINDDTNHYTAKFLITE